MRSAAAPLSEPAPQREVLDAGRYPVAALARPSVAFAALAVVAVAAVPLFDVAPVLSPPAWVADALLDGRSGALPAVALAAHAAAVVALAAWGLRRTA